MTLYRMTDRNAPGWKPGRGRVAVVGAGAAGMASAIAAARAGADVTLVDQRPSVGGTVAHALIHTIGGLYDDHGGDLNAGLAAELNERLEATGATRRRRIGKTNVLNVCPDAYAAVVESWLAETPQLAVLTGARLNAVDCDAGRVAAIELSTDEGTVGLPVDQVVDASGSASLVRRIDPALAYDDPNGAAGGLIFRMRGVRPGSFVFPNSAKVLRRLRKSAAAGSLPAECAHAWLDEGVADDEVYVKLFVPLRSSEFTELSREELCDRLERTQAAIVAMLKSYDGFAEAWVDRVGDLGVRDGGRVHGDYCLTEDDVRSCRTFADAACRCNWPIEYWDAADGVRLEYLPENASYDIPLRSLKVRHTDNVWAVGKCLSADTRAQASARIVGACWAMGDAAGRVSAERAATNRLAVPRVTPAEAMPLQAVGEGTP